MSCRKLCALTLSGLLHAAAFFGGASVAHAAETVTASRPVTLTVQIDVQPKDSEERRPVLPGETLRTGDRIALRVEVDQRAYIKVVQIFPSGQSAVLFPMRSTPVAQTLIEPGVQQRIPAGGGMFELDTEVGQENIVVTASLNPIGEAAPEVEKTLVNNKPAAAATPPLVASAGTRLSTESGAAAPPPPPPPPPPPYPLEPGERGIAGQVPGKPHALRVRAAKSGVAVVTFGFKHASASAQKAATTGAKKSPSSGR